MTWEILAYDIAARVEQDEREDLLAEARELADAERATQVFADRIRAFTGRDISIALNSPDRSALSGRLITSGTDWLLIHDGGYQHIVMAASVTRLYAPRFAQEAPAGLPVSIGSILRELQGAPVTATCIDGTVSGVIAGVGKNYLVLNISDDSPHRGMHAREWGPRYEYGSYGGDDSVAVPFSAVALLSQAFIHAHT